jgi:hypothetical protein
MSLALNAIQQALYTKLTGDGVLMGMVSGVYDAVPQRTVVPYVVIGDGETQILDGPAHSDTRVTLDIDVWTATDGRKTALTIMDRMYGLLHQSTMTVTGFTLIAMRCDAALTALIEEGPNLRGTLTVEMLVRLV